MRFPFPFLRNRNFGLDLLIVFLLGFGLGWTALLYTALDRLLLHPLEAPVADRLVRAADRRPPVTSWEWFPFTTYQRMQSLKSFELLAVEGDVETTFLSHSGFATPAMGAMVSGGYFDMLGGHASIGRVLTQADESGSNGLSIVLSHRLWQSEFGGATTVLGQSLKLQGQLFTIVGVMPERFFGTRIDNSPDFWVPLPAQAALSEKTLTSIDSDRHFSIVGKLRSGVSREQAQAEFASLYSQIRVPDRVQGEGLLAPIAEGSFALREQFGRALRLLLWGGAALLAMVGASISGMLVARTMRRERDTAVRIALGAGHLRMVAGALRESALLGAAGGCLGLAFAYLGAPLLVSTLPAGRTPLPISLAPDLGIDCCLIAFALGLSVAFGTIPAWLSLQVKPQIALRRGTATRPSGMFGRALMIFESGATIVLLMGTGLLLHTFYALRHADPGFDVPHLVTFTLHLRAEAAKTSAAVPLELQRRIETLPGVRAVGYSDAPLMQRIGIKTTVALPGEKLAPQTFLNTSLNQVSSGFFGALGIPLLAGRDLVQTDVTQKPLPTPTVVNEAFAQTFFPGQNPIGQRFGMGEIGTTAKASNLVIGVVGDSKYRSLREARLPIFYMPIEPTDDELEIYLYVRTSGPPQAIIRAVRETLAKIAPQLPFTRVATMQEQVDDSLWQERLLVTLAIVFSVVSVLMAGMSLYGLLAYDARQRTREFGVRMAVGAQRSDIGRLMAAKLAGILVPGVGLGVVGCLGLSRVIGPMLYGVRSDDPVSCGGTLLALLIVNTAALGQPLCRAMQSDPSVVLREE